MRLSRWFALIGVLVAIGCVQVAQRNAVYLSGYGVGERIDEMHARHIDVSWLQARVIELSSPSQLAASAKEQDLKLVAAATLDPAVRLSALVQLAAALPLRSNSGGAARASHDE